MYVIVTNHVNWHRENLPSDRENTGNLKMKFEWVPCQMYFHIISHLARFTLGLPYIPLPPAKAVYRSESCGSIKYCPLPHLSQSRPLKAPSTPMFITSGITGLIFVNLRTRGHGGRTGNSWFLLVPHDSGSTSFLGCT